ncbi:hypothetical protein Patl1_15702 [Pistacia atlantica]|uniref:Uncharacterized protein n=1 Tax=Pistacia atlantica TaxID=434234 RepID=A0ACC1B7E7_9ROSI|nr:hypothetical protein Patl1_15702 [Pistacia atlantica]
MVDFFIMDYPPAYNVVLGRPILVDILAITSIACQTMKFPTPINIEIVRSS